MNKVILIGRLVENPVIRTNGEVSVANFRLAVNRTFKNKEGKYEADFISCKAFNNQATFIERYFKKGNMIALTGKIQTGSYKKNEETRYITEVVVETSEFCGEKNDAKETKPSDDVTDVPANYKSDYVETTDDFKLTDADLPF